MNRNTLVVALAMALPLSLESQDKVPGTQQVGQQDPLPTEALSRQAVFRSVQEALDSPSPVYRLDLSTAGRDVSVIFGDGAGALVLEGVDASAGTGVLEVRIHAQGKYARKLWTEGPSSATSPRISHEMIDDRRVYPYMDGRFVFKHAVTRMPEILLETLHAASVKIEEVDLFLFHQANLRINEFVAHKLEIPEEKIKNNIQRLGNCSAAALPILLDEACREGRLQPGQLVSLTAFGSGFTWGSAVVRWG